MLPVDILVRCLVLATNTTFPLARRELAMLFTVHKHSDFSTSGC